MGSSRKISAIDLVELSLARQILFRVDRDEIRFPSTHVIVERERTSMSTVREALQRLIALGLVRTSTRKGPVLPGLHRVQSADSLPLMIRAAENKAQRQHAFGQLTRAARWLMVEGMVLALGTRGADRSRLMSELEELRYLLHHRALTADAAFQLHFIGWLVGSLSREVGLEWIGTALDRAFPHAWPWLAAAIDWDREEAGWLRVLESFQEGSKDAVRSAVAAALDPWHADVIHAAASSDPERQLPPSRQSASGDDPLEDDDLPF